MKSRRLIFILFLMAASCTKAIHDHTKQGVQGNVLNSEQQAMRNLEVCVYSPVSVSDTSRTAYLPFVNSNLIKTSRVDQGGEFKINLAPGQYSIFLKTPHGFLKSSTLVQGILNGIEVKNNTFNSINYNISTLDNI